MFIKKIKRHVTNTVGLKSLVKYCYLDFFFFLLLYFVNCTFCLFRYMCSVGFIYAGSHILNVNLFFLIYCSAHSSIMLPGANKHSANNSQQTRQHNPILCSIQLLKSPHRSFPAFSASSVELERSVPSFGPPNL